MNYKEITGNYKLNWDYRLLVKNCPFLYLFCLDYSIFFGRYKKVFYGFVYIRNCICTLIHFISFHRSCSKNGSTYIISQLELGLKGVNEVNIINNDNMFHNYT